MKLKTNLSKPSWSSGFIQIPVLIIGALIVAAAAIPLLSNQLVSRKVTTQERAVGDLPWTCNISTYNDDHCGGFVGVTNSCNSTDITTVGGCEKASATASHSITCRNVSCSQPTCDSVAGQRCESMCPEDKLVFGYNCSSGYACCDVSSSVPTVTPASCPAANCQPVTTTCESIGQNPDSRDGCGAMRHCCSGTAPAATPTSLPCNFDNCGSNEDCAGCSNSNTYCPANGRCTVPPPDASTPTPPILCPSSNCITGECAPSGLLADTTRQCNPDSLHCCVPLPVTGCNLAQCSEGTHCFDRGESSSTNCTDGQVRTCNGGEGWSRCTKSSVDCILITGQRCFVNSCSTYADYQAGIGTCTDSATPNCCAPKVATINTPTPTVSCVSAGRCAYAATDCCGVGTYDPSNCGASASYSCSAPIPTPPGGCAGCLQGTTCKAVGDIINAFGCLNTTKKICESNHSWACYTAPPLPTTDCPDKINNCKSGASCPANTVPGYGLCGTNFSCCVPAVPINACNLTSVPVCSSGLTCNDSPACGLDCGAGGQSLKPYSCKSNSNVYCCTTRPAVATPTATVVPTATVRPPVPTPVPCLWCATSAECSRSSGFPIEDNGFCSDVGGERQCCITNGGGVEGSYGCTCVPRGNATNCSALGGTITHQGGCGGVDWDFCCGKDITGSSGGGGGANLVCDAYSGYGCVSNDEECVDLCTPASVGKKLNLTDLTTGGRDHTAYANDSCGTGKKCCQKTSSCQPAQNMCLININPNNVTNRTNSNRFNVEIYNLPSLFGYTANPEEARDANGSCSNFETHLKIGSSESSLATPLNCGAENSCTRSSCTSTGTNSWTYKAGDPKVCCSGWMNNNTGAVGTYCQNLGMATGSIPDTDTTINRKVLRGGNITFKFTITGADKAPPKVRLHDTGRGEDHVVYSEDSSVQINSSDILAHDCTMAKTGDYTWSFTCKAPNAAPGSYKVVFSNQYSVEAELSYQIVTVLPTLCPARCSTVYENQKVQWKDTTCTETAPAEATIIRTFDPECHVSAAAKAKQCNRCSKTKDGEYKWWMATNCDLDPTGETITVSNPSCKILNATCSIVSFPDTVKAGEEFLATLSLTNTGGLTWTKAAGIKGGNASCDTGNNGWVVINQHGFCFPDVTGGGYGNPRALLGDTEKIRPGESKRWLVSVKAPAVVGSIKFYWRAVQESVAWFGGFCEKTVAVTAVVGPSPTATTTPGAGTPTPTPTTESCPRKLLGNLDCSLDGKINTADFSILVGNFGKRGSSILGDISSTSEGVTDGLVNTSDFSYMIKNWGTGGQ